MQAVFEKYLKPIKRALSQIVARGVVTGSDDAKKWRELQLVARDGEPLDQIEHAEPYGFTSHPKADAEAILLSVGGRRAHTLAIIVGDRRYRIKSLPQGAVALYDASGTKIVLNNDNTIAITASGGVTVNGDLNIEGKVTASSDIASTGGDIKDKTRSMQQMVDQHNAHTQTDLVTGAGISVPVVPMT